MPEPVLERPPAARADVAPLLVVRGLNAWYGESHILHGVDFDVASGEVVTLLGRNGAGKTTTLRSIMGIVPRREGSILFEGDEGSAGVKRLRHGGAPLCDHGARGAPHPRRRSSPP